VVAASAAHKITPELLDLPPLLDAVALGVVYRAMWATLIAVGGLPRPLVTSWATTPTSRCSSSESTSQRLVVVVVAVDLLLLPISVFAAALSSGFCFGLADVPCL
jgi:hypothetical protein